MMLTMCTAFLLIFNLCTIMRDSIHRAITQTIHTHLISWVCSVTRATFPYKVIKLQLDFVVIFMAYTGSIQYCTCLVY